MSEKLSSNHEVSEGSTEDSAERPQQHKERPSKPSHEHDAQKSDIEQIRERAEQEALNAHELRVEETDKESSQPSQAFVNKELKSLAYRRLLNRARKHMNPAQKLLSKVVHQPAVEAISETAAKTVARPSGILGGGLLAFAGTITYYYLTKHYGYNYNYFVFLGLLVGGFIAGWLTEILLHFARNSKR